MTTATAKKTDRIAAVLAEKQKLQAERLSPLDFPGTWTQRERDAYEATTRLLWIDISRIVNLAPEVARYEATLATEAEWRAHLVGWEKALCDEILALPPREPQTKHEMGVETNLRISLVAVRDGNSIFHLSGYSLETSRLGALMRASGFIAGPAAEGRIFGELPWYGSLAEVDARVKDASKRRNEALANLEESLRDRQSST